jgi:hypothetical protein
MTCAAQITTGRPPPGTDDRSDGLLSRVARGLWLGGVGRVLAHMRLVSPGSSSARSGSRVGDAVSWLLQGVRLPLSPSVLQRRSGAVIGGD